MMFTVIDIQPEKDEKELIKSIQAIISRYLPNHNLSIVTKTQAFSSFSSHKFSQNLQKIWQTMIW